MPRTTILLPYLGRWDQFRKSRFHQIATRLANDGYDVHVIQAPPLDSTEVTFQRRNIEVPDNVTIHEADLQERIWNAPLINKVLKKGYYGVGVRKQVRQLIQSEDVDCLWLYNLPHYPLAGIDDVPIVFDFVDDYVAMLNHELGVSNDTPFTGLVRYFFARLLDKVDLITVISHELRDDVREMIGESIPIEIIPNGVDTDVFPLAETERSSLDDPPTIGFVGSFEYFIDFDQIIDAAAELPEVRFLLVGDGREFEYVEQQVQSREIENVELPGLVESHEVPGCISKMDVCLNTFERTPLSHSAVPLKLFEYLSMNRPVISTRLQEVQTIDQGFLYYADDSTELADTIQVIIGNYSEAIDRTSAALPVLRDEYNWDVIASDFQTALGTHIGVGIGGKD